MITVMLDGDEGIPIAECSRVNRRISSRIDEEVPDEVGAFIVDVSSPGVDKPLMLLRQLPKHIGRRIEFVDDLGVKQEGTFKELKDEVLVLEQAYKEKGKKQQILLNEYNWKQLHDPKVVVTFKR
jgi:ribosome maturation factor RimP